MGIEKRVSDIVDWIDLAQDWNIRRGFANIIMRKCGEFLDLGNCYLLKKVSAPRSHKLGKEYVG